MNKLTETTLKGFRKARFHREVFLFSFPRSVMKQQRPDSANPFSDPATEGGSQRRGDQAAPRRRRCGAVVTPIADNVGGPALHAASCTLLPFQGWIWEAADSQWDVTLLGKRVMKVKKNTTSVLVHMVQETSFCVLICQKAKRKKKNTKSHQAAENVKRTCYCCRCRKLLIESKTGKKSCQQIQLLKV